MSQDREEVTIRELRTNLAEVLYRVKYNQRRIQIYKYDKKVAALISLEGLSLLEALEQLEGIDGSEDKRRLTANIRYRARHGELPADLSPVEEDLLLGLIRID